MIDFFRVLVFVLLCNSVFAQVTISEIQHAPFLGVCGLDSSYNYQPTVKRVGVHPHNRRASNSIPAIEFQNPDEVIDLSTARKRAAEKPNVLGTYAANFFDGVPPDNSIAVSNGSYIITAENSNINIFDLDGNRQRIQSFSVLVRSVFSDLKGVLYDPKVIYDQETGKFILVFLHGTTSSNSKIMVFFSKTANPLDGWNAYALPGDVVGTSYWTDYPSIGINSNALFITGNLFDNSESFRESFILQIDKNQGFSGAATVDFKSFTGIKDSKGNYAFTISPVNQGKKGIAGNSMYFVCSDDSRNNYLMIYEITGKLNETSTTLKTSNVTISQYANNTDAGQKGTTDKIKTGDSRMSTAVIVNGNIHCVFSSQLTSGHSAVNYVRVNPKTLVVNTKTIGESGFWYTYPSIAVADETPDSEVLFIVFGRVSSTIFPQLCALSVNSNLEVSDRVLLKEGESFGDATSDDLERWGDYFSMARKFNGNTCYAFGCVPNSQNNWANYFSVLSVDEKASIAETKGLQKIKIYPNPTSEKLEVAFFVDKLMEHKMEVYDQSGRLVEVLIKDALKPGSFNFSFNINPLQKGNYILVISNEEGLVSSTPFIKL